MTYHSVRLDLYDNQWFKPGAGKFKRICWYVINAVLFINPLLHSNALKLWLLRIFGAKIGKGVVIKPGVNIKYPWHLQIGDWVWIGEGVWIDNLTKVTLGNHVCISQGAMLLTGNHDYKTQTFDLIVSPITLEEGFWAGAKSLVCPGVSGGSHAILTAGSVATSTLMPYTIYQGNPAVSVRQRSISARSAE